jgi:phosphoribosylpyrophosphate synthetase
MSQNQHQKSKSLQRPLRQKLVAFKIISKGCSHKNKDHLHLSAQMKNLTTNNFKNLKSIKPKLPFKRQEQSKSQKKRKSCKDSNKGIGNLH